MKKRVAWLGALVAAAGMLVYAADIDGKWTAETEGRNGKQTQTLTLKADGEKLTGTLDGGRGMPAEISEGMVHGSDVMFKVVREFNGNKIEQNYKGSVSGSELKLTREGGRGGPQEMTFKKAQ